MVSNTTYKLLQVPTVNADTGLWGGYLNNTINDLDSILGQYIALPSSTYGQSATPTSSMLQAAGFFTAGSSIGAMTVTLLSSIGGNGTYSMFNNSTSFNMVVQGSTTPGLTVTIPPSTNRLIIASGGNIFFADPQSALPLQAGIEFGMDGSSLPPQTGRKPGVVLPWSFTVQGWQINCADSSAASISLNFEAGYGTISGASSLGFASNISAAGTSSGWGTTSFSSGIFLSVNVISDAVGTKFTACLFGVRTT